MSCLLEIERPFAWTLLNTEDSSVEFPMNPVAFALLEDHDEHHSDAGSEDDTALHRIENKVNLILQMLGQMMQSGATLPVKTKLQLSADEIAWHFPEAMVDQAYQVGLYLSEDYRLPINMVAQVIKIESGCCHARINFHRIEEQATWEHWVFRQHRRHIALARAQATI